MNKKNNQSNKSNDSMINIVLVVIAVLIVITGGYVLFFKNKKTVNNLTVDMITKQYGNVEFTSKVSGQSGDLYLDNDGRIYFALSNNLRNNSDLLSFVRVFKTEKNDVYNSDTIEAILLNILNVNRINYINKDIAMENYYLITVNGGKQLSILDYEISQNKILNFIDNVEYNDLIDEFNGVYLSRMTNHGADVQAIIGEEEVEDIVVQVKDNNVTVYRKRDGKNYILKNDGKEIEVSEEVKNNLDAATKGYIKVIDDYCEDKYGKNMENLTPPNKIVQIDGHTTQAIDDEYGKVRVDEYMGKHNITLDRVVQNKTSMPGMCNCMGYWGYKDDDYNICRDVTGSACWTEKEGYINPYLRPTIDEETGKYSSTKRVDISYSAEHHDAQMEKKIKEAVASGNDKWWVYINGKLTVGNPSGDLSKADTGLYRDRLTGAIAGFECFGDAETCKGMLKTHVALGDFPDTTIPDVDSLFEHGYKTDYYNPKDYHTDEKVSDTGQTETKPSSTPGDSQVTVTPKPTSTPDSSSCYKQCIHYGGKSDYCETQCGYTPKATVTPTPKVTPKPTLRKCDDIDREECNASTGTWNESSCTCTTATPTSQATPKTSVSLNPNDQVQS